MRLLISTIYLLRAITSISLALAEPFGYNNHNDQTVIDTERILVPGPNPVGAYYCGPESKHHLFRISQLTVAPFPIPVYVLRQKSLLLAINSDIVLRLSFSRSKAQLRQIQILFLPDLTLPSKSMTTNLAGMKNDYGITH